MSDSTVEMVDEIEVFQNDIMLYLHAFCEEQDIDIMKKESQSVWNGALRYIRKHVFFDRDVLKSKDNLNIHNNAIPSTFNSYDYDRVNSLCDMYIDLCFIYDKEVSIIGFSNLTGIDTDTINEWGSGRVKLSPTSTVIYKKLRDFREESLSNKLVTGRQNPVGILGVLNHHYAWNTQEIKQETPKYRQRTREEIMASYGDIGIEADREFPEPPEWTE